MAYHQLRKDQGEPKRCSRCGLVLGESKFAPSVWKKQGGWCKPCLNKYYNAKRGDRSCTYHYRFVKRRRRERADFVMAFKAERGCIYCGERHPASLDLHHREQDGKIDNVRKMVDKQMKYEVIEAEMAKCDVVCSNCHRKLHFKEGGIHYWKPETRELADNIEDLRKLVAERMEKYPVNLVKREQ